VEERPAKQSVYARKFRTMLRLISAPDGGQWTGTKMERATGGKVSTSYFSSLRDGHIEIPRADKIEAIAEAMGFSPGLWFKELEWWEGMEESWEKGRGLGAALEGEQRKPDGERLSNLLNRLFETNVDEETGEPFTNEKVARQSGGVLTEGDVEAMRVGYMTDPTWAQILALCDVFGVDVSYWAGERDAPSWRPSPAVLEVAEGRESYLIFQNSLKLSGRDRSMLKMLAEHLRREQETDPS
jgi:transcriptional regulator with XRE-family HTH domain